MIIDFTTAAYLSIAFWASGSMLSIAAKSSPPSKNSRRIEPWRFTDNDCLHRNLLACA